MGAPSPVDLCGNCGDPGRCCREIRLFSGNDWAFRNAGTRLEAMVALATVGHDDPWMGNIGLPFIAERKDADGYWVMSCVNLTPEGRCGDYEGRPYLCRLFEPGTQFPCAMSVLPPLPDPNDVAERREMGEDRASRDRLTPQARSRLMSRIMGQGTRPERALQAALDRIGVRYETHARDLTGRPDVVLRDARLAVFMDGDFWHGWKLGGWIDTLAPFWQEKLTRNRLRDRRVDRELRAAGWTVLRIWEHQVNADAAACARRVAHAARKATRGRHA